VLLRQDNADGYQVIGIMDIITMPTVFVGVMADAIRCAGGEMGIECVGGDNVKFNAQ
jgi:hypothetical protein